MSLAGEDITTLLGLVRQGDNAAKSRLAEAVYRELHRMAEHYMRSERQDHTLQATILVHDTYRDLIGDVDRNWQNRSHFYAAAARAMRRILIDYARSHRAEKRGGTRVRIELDENLAFTYDKVEELLALNDALLRLTELDARQGEVVELKFFGGLTDEEIGQLLNISSRTVRREWITAKGWLHSQLALSAKA